MQDKVMENLAGLIGAMSATNTNIRDRALSEQKLMQDLHDLNLQIARKEIELSELVLSAKENDKFKYTNDTTRKLAIEKSQLESKEYQELISKKQKLGFEYGKTKIEKEYDERQLKIWHIMFSGY